MPEGLGQRLLGSFTVQAALLLAFFPVAWLAGRRLDRTALDAYALTPSAAAIRWSVVFFALAVACKAAAAGIGRGMGVYAVAAGTTASRAALLPGLAITFAPSIAEDIVTRGFWLRGSGIRWRPAVFVVTSSVIYVLNHIYRLGLGPGEWLMLFVFGLAYATAAVHFDSLWPAVGLHWGWNYGNLLVGSLWPLTTMSGRGGRMLSMAAHLVMGCAVLCVPRQRAKAGSA